MANSTSLSPAARLKWVEAVAALAVVEEVDAAQQRLLVRRLRLPRLPRNHRDY
jgi:hypothetical protein